MSSVRGTVSRTFAKPNCTTTARQFTFWILRFYIFRHHIKPEYSIHNVNCRAVVVQLGFAKVLLTVPRTDDIDNCL
jgi:hypothetical protein